MEDDLMPKTEAEVRRGKTAWDEWRERNGIEKREVPRAKKVPITEEMLERRAVREQKMDEHAYEQRIKNESGRMGGGSGRGGSLGNAGPKNLGGKVPEMKKGGSVKSASSRADGIAQRGKTRGRVI